MGIPAWQGRTGDEPTIAAHGVDHAVFSARKGVRDQHQLGHASPPSGEGLPLFRTSLSRPPATSPKAVAKTAVRPLAPPLWRKPPELARVRDFKRQKTARMWVMGPNACRQSEKAVAYLDRPLRFARLDTSTWKRVRGKRNIFLVWVIGCRGPGPVLRVRALGTGIGRCRKPSGNKWSGWTYLSYQPWRITSLGCGLIHNRLVYSTG